MLNKIEAYKNTGVIPQKITIECVNASIYFSTFNEMVEEIFEAVNASDTENPYNTYNIKTYDMDIDGDVIEEKDWDSFYLKYQISFSEASDLNTTYSFGEEQSSFQYIADDIVSGILQHFIYNKNYPEDTPSIDDVPPIIITDAKFVIYPNGD